MTFSLPKFLLKYVGVNLITLALVFFSVIYPIEAIGVVTRVLLWIIAIMALVQLPMFSVIGAKRYEQFGQRGEPFTGFNTFDATFDFGLVVIFAYHQWYWTAIACLIMGVASAAVSRECVMVADAAAEAEAGAPEGANPGNS